MTDPTHTTNYESEARPEFAGFVVSHDPGRGRSHIRLQIIDEALTRDSGVEIDLSPAPLRRHREPRHPPLEISSNIRRQRRLSLASVAKQARKAGIEVARYEVKPDGTVVIVNGQPESAEPGNPWPLD